MMKKIPAERYRVYFLATLILPAILLCGMLIQPITTLIFGSSVTLATQPVDPRDLFRGDYVRLSLAIRDIHLDTDLGWTSGKPLLPGINDPYELADKSLYVLLKPAGDVYSIRAVSLKKPADDLYLKGRVVSVYSDSNRNIPNLVVMDYGIDSYYVPEGTGKSLEEMARKGALKATIKIYKGYGIIEKLEPLH